MTNLDFWLKLGGGGGGECLSEGVLKIQPVILFIFCGLNMLKNVPKPNNNAKVQRRGVSGFLTKSPSLLYF